MIIEYNKSNSWKSVTKM